MDESFSALYAVYFQTLRLVDPAFRIGLEARRSSIPAQALAVMKLPEALELLAGDKGRPRQRKHAALALSWLHWASFKGDPYLTGELADYQPRIQDFLKYHDVDSERLRLAKDASEAFLAPLASSCAPQNFWIRTKFFSGTDVTTCAAGVEVNRNVSEFRELLDPRVWHTTVPETFAKAFRTTAVPVEPESDPADADAGGMVPPLGGAWTGKLFEQANWPIGAIFVTARNLLGIDYQHLVAGGSERLFLEYSLAECLTTQAEFSDVPGSTFIRQFGGIDHDSGFVDVRPMPSGLISLSAKKSLRFTGEIAWLNAISPAYLFVWMSLCILAEACYHFSPPAE